MTKHDGTTDALHILMVADMPWDLRLGAPSVQMQIGAHLSAAGHKVDYFGLRDVFPRAPRTRVGRLFAPPFSMRAVSAVRSRAQNYDVIDAQQGNLPMNRSRLHFDGILVTRSAGLMHAYGRFVTSIPQRWDNAPPTNRWARPVRRAHVRGVIRRTEASFRASDLILVPNPVEAEELASIGFGARTRVVPNGIPDELLEAAAKHRSMDTKRASERRVSVIATWDLRKGKLDWPRIIPAVRRRVPEATFTFLGTRVDEGSVRTELGHPEGVEVVPAYDPADLPELLCATKAGALASYVEGFGLGLVEQMACGVPAVSYDVAGPRHTVGAVHNDLLVPEGDVEAFSERLAHVLMMQPSAYAALAGDMRDSAGRFRYSKIAAETLLAYRAARASRG